MSLNLDIDLNDLTLDSIGSWPLPVRIGVVIATSVLILIFGFWFDTRSQFSALDNAEQEEAQLRVIFESKQHQAAGLFEYKKQLAIMEDIFKGLLKQLPSSTEVPGLLEDISQQGLASGLEFKSIKPMPEVPHQFYAELPIQISVVGTYHQIATFISNVSALPRIVNFSDFTVKRVDDPNTTTNKNASAVQIAMKQDQEPQLQLDIMASTYRYLESNEQAKANPENAPNPSAQTSTGGA